MEAHPDIAPVGRRCRAATRARRLIRKVRWQTGRFALPIGGGVEMRPFDKSIQHIQLAIGLAQLMGEVEAELFQQLDFEGGA